MLLTTDEGHLKSDHHRNYFIFLTTFPPRAASCRLDLVLPYIAAAIQGISAHIVSSAHGDLKWRRCRGPIGCG
jgi:hypothetical protein